MRYTCTHTVEDIITDNNGTRIKVIATYGINDDRISVTGDVYYERQDNDGFFFDNEPDDCGMVHDRILQAFPWLRQLIDLHLADARTGAPMYALDNGWYWLREDDPNDRYNAIITDKSRRRAAQYLRTTPPPACSKPSRRRKTSHVSSRQPLPQHGKSRSTTPSHSMVCCRLMRPRRTRKEGLQW